MELIKILIVDDHPIVREGLKLILELEKQFEIIDEASNGMEALKLMKENSYDLIFLDIFMPIMNGIEFLEEKNNRGNETSVIILTTSDDKETIEKAMNLGAKGFMLKDTTRGEMLQTVYAVLRGEVFVSTEVKEILAHKNSNALLTEKEMLVLGKVVKGAASKEIAIDMGITERTVKAHLTNIYRKLEVNSRIEAVALAIKRKLVEH